MEKEAGIGWERTFKVERGKIDAVFYGKIWAIKAKTILCHYLPYMVFLFEDMDRRNNLHVQ